MKRILIFISFLFLVACASAQEITQPTYTPIPPTATLAPSETPLPSPTSTPEPYLLEEGVLLDWNENSGEYIMVVEGVDALVTTDEGVILALDGTGFPRFVFTDNSWVEIQIPEGAENYEELSVPDRHVSVVNEQGKVEEVLESGVKALVNPETGLYEYEFKNGQWVDYVERVMIVGEKVVKEDHPMIHLGYTEVPREVVESAVETMRNAKLFTRDGVELKTGYDEVLGE